MEFGIVGLGKMGTNLALQAVGKGIRVVGFDPGIDSGREEELRNEGVELSAAIKGLMELLRPPRTVFLYVPAGPTVDQVLRELVALLDEGDIVLDGGNSHFRDSQARQRRLARHGIGYVDCGTSGGLEGARQGACFMVGGEVDVVKVVEPVLKALAVPGGYTHVGKPGAGHFAKLVHNGIEFGMLQAIGEGFALLRKSEYEIDIAALFHTWAYGSVIRGWLVELMARGLRERQKEGMANVSSYVEDTGEVNWLIEEALRMEVPIPVISESVMALFRSRDEDSAAAKAVAVLRHEFGGHPFGRAEAVARERRLGQVGLRE
ncbi:MAG: decarboxylating 6-phosphogluconate dehydrogenase [Dehalococcoidia bacterium]